MLICAGPGGVKSPLIKSRLGVSQRSGQGGGRTLINVARLATFLEGRHDELFAAQLVGDVRVVV